MLATARDRMAAMVGNGMSEEEALAAKPFADLDAKWAGNERTRSTSSGWPTTCSSGRDSDDQGHGLPAQQIGRPCLQGRRVSRKSSLDHPEREITLVCGDAVPTFQNKKVQFRLIRAAKNPRRG
jgi:hypothetical protein